jgi:hypothetical protein
MLTIMGRPQLPPGMQLRQVPFPRLHESHPVFPQLGLLPPQILEILEATSSLCQERVLSVEL